MLETLNTIFRETLEKWHSELIEFKAVNRRRKCEGAVKATWVNIAFSYRALTLLAKDTNKFEDESFEAGMAKQSRKGILDDPSDRDNLEGSPKNWVFGGREENEADIVLIIASDDPFDLAAEVARIEKSVYQGTTGNGKPIPSGVQIIYKQQAANLTGALRGHEHFGFRERKSAGFCVAEFLTVHNPTRLRRSLSLTILTVV